MIGKHYYYCLREYPDCPCNYCEKCDYNSPIPCCVGHNVRGCKSHRNCPDFEAEKEEIKTVKKFNGIFCRECGAPAEINCKPIWSHMVEGNCISEVMYTARCLAGCRITIADVKGAHIGPDGELILEMEATE